MKILIVDDNADDRVLLERALMNEGYSVSSATNGLLALERALDSPPDLIISDIMMPEMDGFELCHRVKLDDRLRHVAFIFYTATYVERKDEQLNAGGIPPEIIDKIFEPYFTTKGPEQGTGLGLFMSKTIIEKNMDGVLSVRNAGVGAEFRINMKRRSFSGH